MDKQIKEMEKIPSWHRVRGLTEAKEFLKFHLSKLEKETAYSAEKLTRDTIKKLAKAREKYETAEYMDDGQADSLY